MRNIFLICVVKLVFNELNNLISPLDVAVVCCLYAETTKIRKRRRTCIDVTADKLAAGKEAYRGR